MDKACSTASHSVPQCTTGTVRTEERNARTCIFDTRGYRALEHAAVDMAGTLFTRGTAVLNITQRELCTIQTLSEGGWLVHGGLGNSRDRRGPSGKRRGHLGERESESGIQIHFILHAPSSMASKPPQRFSAVCSSGRSSLSSLCFIRQ